MQGRPFLGRSVAILGCARNCSAYLGRSLRNVRLITSQFQHNRVFLFENDSEDTTRQALQRFVLESPSTRTLTTERFLAARAPGRTRRLAYIRQRLHEKLAASGYTPEVVVVLDLDDVGASCPGRLYHFLSSACTFAGWDAAFPMLSYDRAAWRAWPGRQPRLGVGVPGRPVRVASGFNGIGVYKGGVYARGSYRMPGQQLLGRHSRPGPCEHVTFHASLGPRTKLAMLTDCRYPK